jgi:histidinol-phosphatase (PHP family)
MIVDYHMHLRDEEERIAHSVDIVERWVEAARAHGVDEIGFTEHVYYFRETRSLWSRQYELERCVYPLEPYVEAVVEAKRRGLPVKLGLEVDYLPGREDETRALLEPYPWDYLLGSVHYVDDLAIDAEPSLVAAIGPEAAYARYAETLTAAAGSGLFDSLSHPDLVKFFGVLPGWDWSPLLDAAAGRLCLEVSTAGLYKPHGRIYPEPELLRAAHERGIPITLAADAHVPANVGRDLDRGIEHARAAGYETLTVFEAREARQEPLG